MENKLDQIARSAKIELHKAFGKLGGGHYGGCLSIIEILVQLYFREMRVDPANPQWPQRDRLVLSKGHAGFGLYAVLAQRGFFPSSKLSELENGVMLPKHADKHRVPGVDVSTGSLAQGISIAVGMAIAAQKARKGVRVFSVLGDGELNEGQVWEAAMTAAKYKLDNLIAVVDRNRLSVDGNTDEVMPMGDLEKKWEAFGWNVEKADGHDFAQLSAAFAKARASTGRPTVIIANTVKGKGISFMEGVMEWHGGACTPEQQTQGTQRTRKRTGIGGVKPCLSWT